MKDFTLALEGRLSDAIAAREAARSRRRRRFLLAVPALAAAAAFAFAALPAADPSRTAAPASAADILRTASAAASEQRGLEGYGGVRYVRQTYYIEQNLVDHGCEGCKPVIKGRYAYEQSRDAWIGSDWWGTAKWDEPRKVSGDGDEWRERAGKPGEERFQPVGQSVFRVPLDQLPTDAVALQRKLLDSIDPPNASAAHAKWELLIAADALLGISNAPSDLRAAAYGMLARIDGAKALGETRDSGGRLGQAIEISGGDDGTFTFVIDPATGALLESTTDYGSGPVSRVTYDASARVSTIGERP